MVFCSKGGNGEVVVLFYVGGGAAKAAPPGPPRRYEDIFVKIGGWAVVQSYVDNQSFEMVKKVIY
jgi:hypothetical protein